MRRYGFCFDDGQGAELEAWAREKGFKTLGDAAKVALIARANQYPSKTTRKVADMHGYENGGEDPCGGTPQAL